MENHVEVLEHLIGLKKTKKEPNRFERDQFTEAWNSMIAKEGYSVAVEEFLYNGFTYCGADPLKAYIKNSEDKIEAINSIYAGKMYGKNCANTVSILFHLLTLFLNEKNCDLEIISALIRAIPTALKNKEGKIYGQADRVLKKYVLDVLHCDTLPSFDCLIDAGLETVFVKDFIASFDEIITGMKAEGFSRKCFKNIKQIQDWMHPVLTETIGENTAVDAVEDKPAEGVASNEIPADKEDNTTDVTDSIENALDQAKAELADVKKKWNKDICDLKSQKDLVTSLKTQLAEMAAEKERLGEILSARESRISVLFSDLAIAKRKNEELERKVAQREQELSERIKLTEALSRDRAKQSDEAFNRLASKLRVEFRDFMDAVDIPMDGDLGENMREQLKNIFNILIKAGIAIN